MIRVRQPDVCRILISMWIKLKLISRSRNYINGIFKLITLRSLWIDTQALSMFSMHSGYRLFRSKCGTNNGYTAVSI